MRHLLLTATAFAALIGVPAFAADEPVHPKEHEHAHEHAKAEAAAGNKIDPTTGKEVDAKAGTLELKLNKKTVVVGFSSKESYEAASKADDKTKEMIAEAVKTHKLIVDGKLVEGKKSVKKHEDKKHEEKKHEEKKP